jgi:mannose-1-phosphate guanylyltransferase
VNKAFVLGAGLGERLRPLTEQLPKPLVPVLHRPLICHAFDHLARDLGVRDFVVNTFHLAEQYERAFPSGDYQGHKVTLRKDAPVRLETAGGLANVRDLLDGQGTFAVCNGDVLTDLPLAPLLAAHKKGGHTVTLALRSAGPALHIALDQASGCITDIRNKLGTGNEGEYLFTGLYLVEPEFFDMLEPGKPESVIPHFLKLIREGKLGGVVIDEGHWWDLGSRASYLEAVGALCANGSAGLAVHPEACISAGAELHGWNVVGPDAEVGEGACLRECILWPGAKVAPGAKLERCIVRTNQTAEGVLADTDI